MTLLTNQVVVGVSCDARGCDTEHRLTVPVAYFGPEHKQFLRLLLCDGWAARRGRSTYWYCKTHAHRAGRCAGGPYGSCSRWCPVHGVGHAITWATEDAKRLAGQPNILTDARQARDQ